MVSPETPLSLYLVRHGQTEWSLSGRHTGRTDIPLTAEGEDEARALRPWLDHIALTRVLTSPSRRARRTSELAGLGGRAEIEPDLSEWDYGDYEGVTSAEIRKDRPGWSVFVDGCPNGETPGEVAARADRLIARLRAAGGATALFSHGHFGLSLAARWIGAPLPEARRLVLGTASLSILRLDPAHADSSVIALWNARPGQFGHGS